MTKPGNAGAISSTREAYSVTEWCALVGISRAFFYKLPEARRPSVVRLGRRTLITRAAADAWQARMLRDAIEEGAQE